MLTPMQKITRLMAAAFLACAPPGLLTAEAPDNPQIQYAAFAKLTTELEKVRKEHRLSEEDFLKIAKEPGTVILDARSRDKFDGLHIRGAVHLAFTDFTEEALHKLIPEKTTRILIYCNNNFRNSPVLFASKLAEVALNIQTFVNLHAYGYKNVYELGPFLDVKTTRISFEGTAAPQR